MRFTERELTTILYGLRQVQQEEAEFVAGAVHFIDIDPLNDDEIDDLCERLNCDPEPLLDEPRKEPEPGRGTPAWHAAKDKHEQDMERES